MRIKDDTVNIKNLKPILKKRLALFELLHKKLTSQEITITSGNDGIHKNNSKHYTDEAVDIRRWYYDELTEQQKEEIWKSFEQIFPRNYFDVILESDHFHIEFDPKPTKENPQFRDKKANAQIPVEEKEPIKLNKPEIRFTLDEQIDKLNIIKGIINFIFSRLTGFRIFENVKKKSKTLIDYLKELIKFIIKKLKGREQ